MISAFSENFSLTYCTIFPFFIWLCNTLLIYIYILLLYYLLFLLSSLFCVNFEKQNLVGQGIVIFIYYIMIFHSSYWKNIYKNGNFHWFWVFLLSYIIHLIAKTSLESFECYIMKKLYFFREKWFYEIHFHGKFCLIFSDGSGA